MANKPASSQVTTLLERFASREALNLEFKAARTGLPSSVWPTVSAFANTQGGWILLGVAQHDHEVAIEGVTNAHKMLENLHNLVRSPQKISHPMCGADDATIEDVGNKQVIVVRIPAAPRKIRPVYISNNPYTGTYIRRHEGDYHCNKAEVDRMMREASDVGADSAILSHYTWDDLDTDALANYRRLYQTRNSSSPWNAHDDQAFLKAIGGFRRDRTTGEEGITVAGLLLLGLPSALRDWRSRHLIDYRLVENDAAETDARWADRLPWEGNLLHAFNTIYPRLVHGLRLPFRLKGSTRVDESEIHVVLREALVNLLIHADYTESSASLIIRSEDGGYLFRNPGSSRVPESDLFTGDRSDPRNPTLVQMFRHIGLAEEAGTGIPKIIKAWRGLGFQLPAIDVGTERYEFTLDLRPSHLISDEDRAWLLSLNVAWTEEEQLAMVVAKHLGSVDNLELRQFTRQHSVDTTKVLSSLRQRGLLTRSGGGRSAKYKLSSLAGIKASVTEGQGSRLNVPTPPSMQENVINPSSEGNSANSEDKPRSSEGNGANSEDKPRSSEGNEAAATLIWGDLESIAQPARQKRRLAQETRNATLVRLCTRTPLSLLELARLMNRSESYMREALRFLIGTGRLSFLYPEQPSHPQQKYIAVSEARQ